MSSRRKCTDDGRVPRALAQHRRGVAQPGRAPGSGPGGRRFKSSLPDQSFPHPFNYFRSECTGGWPRFDLDGTTSKVGAPSFAQFAKGGYHQRLQRRSLCRAISKRNLSPSLIHPHRSGLLQKIETINAPSPLFWRFHQSSFHRIPMHIPQLLDVLFCRPYVEVVEACLPECPAWRLRGKQIALARVPALALRQQRSRRALLQHLHYGRRIRHLGLGQKKVDVFGHDDIADNDKAIALARLLQNREEAVAAARGAEKRQSSVAGAGDKVPVMSPIGAMHTRPGPSLSFITINLQLSGTKNLFTIPYLGYFLNTDRTICKAVQGG
jgi:hypothetical protein